MFLFIPFEDVFIIIFRLVTLQLKLNSRNQTTVTLPHSRYNNTTVPYTVLIYWYIVQCTCTYMYTITVLIVCYRLYTVVVSVKHSLQKLFHMFCIIHSLQHSMKRYQYTCILCYWLPTSPIYCVSVYQPIIHYILC